MCAARLASCILVAGLAWWGAGCGEAPPPAPPLTPQQRALLRLLPDRAAGWRKTGTPWAVSSDEDLYDRLSARAATFLQFDLKNTVGQTFEHAASRKRAEVRIFEFGSADDAFGAFRMARPGDGALELGDEAVVAPGRIAFRQAEYHVEVEAPEGESVPRSELEALAGAVARSIGRRAPGLPALFELLPRENRVPGSERFARTPYTLQQLRPGFHCSSLGLNRPTARSPGTAVAVADYRLRDEEGNPLTNRIFLVEYPTAEAAAAAYRSYRQDPSARRGAVGRQTALRLAGRYIVGTWNRYAEASRPLMPLVVELIRRHGAPATSPAPVRGG